MLEINNMWLKFHGRLILPLGREILDGLHATAEKKIYTVLLIITNYLSFCKRNVQQRADDEVCTVVDFWF